MSMTQTSTTTAPVLPGIALRIALRDHYQARATDTTLSAVERATAGRHRDECEAWLARHA